MTVDKPTPHLRLVHDSKPTLTPKQGRVATRHRVLMQCLEQAEEIEALIPTHQGPKIQAVKRALLEGDVDTMQEYVDGKHGRFSYCLVLQNYLRDLNS